MSNPKPGAHKPRYYLTTFPPCLEGKTLPRAGDRRREFLPQVSCVTEEHFQRFPFFFFLPRGFSWRRKTERKPRGENNPPAPRLNSFRRFAGGCPVSGWLWGQARSSKGGGSTPFFLGQSLIFQAGGCTPGTPGTAPLPFPAPPGIQGHPQGRSSRALQGQAAGRGLPSPPCP